ncbi:MAG: shikimate dehydrogenase [Burkholderiales bacterium]|jgi:shikimate dehydrogenase|nr:shikimate dehydrogenase [Burkholderiales bacterium]
MQPQCYGVIGNPIGHSLSPQIHEAFSRLTGIPLFYQRISAAVSEDGADFRKTTLQFFAQGGAGLNVTAPFKDFALSFADEAAPRAQKAGAGNTLSKITDGWRADNTDGIGFVRDLERQWGRSAQNARILIYGAGGATAGILEPLLAQKPRLLWLYNRTPQKTQALAERFADDGKIAVLSSLKSLPDEPFDLIINAISARIWKDAESLWKMPTTMPDTFFYDLMYMPDDTPFLRWVKTYGKTRYCDGLGMLIEQAAESFLIWHGVFPDTTSLHSHASLIELRAFRP